MNAYKANFKHVDLAIVYGTFNLVYPKNVFRTLAANKDAYLEGIMFRPVFSSHNIFEGNIDNSMPSLIKKTLTKNKDIEHPQIFVPP